MASLRTRVGSRLLAAMPLGLRAAGSRPRPFANPYRPTRLLGASFSSGSYTLKIYTGDRRGAGTTARVHVSLHGELAATEEAKISDGGFDRAQIATHVFKDVGEIGSLTGVTIGHNNVGDLGVGWFLERVEVFGPGGKDHWIFPASRWLGESDVGSGSGPTSCFLSPRSKLRRIQRPAVEVTAVAAAAFPHPDKVRDGERAVVRKGRGHAGEDAYFYQSIQRSTDTGATAIMALGVADGVYAWREQGIDAGEFSRTLLSAASEAATGVTEEDLAVQHKGEVPLSLLYAAERAVRESGVQGSSTACIACVDGPRARLHVANLGDSGLLVVRNGIAVFRTPEQEHSFGHPFQLGHHDHSDGASDALLYSWGLQDGDIVILGSDGLFDNASDEEGYH